MPTFYISFGFCVSLCAGVNTLISRTPFI